MSNNGGYWLILGIIFFILGIIFTIIGLTIESLSMFMPAGILGIVLGVIILGIVFSSPGGSNGI